MTPDQIRAWLALEGWEPVVWFISANSLGLMHRERDLSVWISDDDCKVGSWDKDCLSLNGAALDDPGMQHLPVHIVDDRLMEQFYDEIVNKGWA